MHNYLFKDLYLPPPPKQKKHKPPNAEIEHDAKQTQGKRIERYLNPMIQSSDVEILMRQADRRVSLNEKRKR